MWSILFWGKAEERRSEKRREQTFFSPFPLPVRPLKCSLPLTPEEDLILEGLSGADARYNTWIGTLSKDDDDGSENVGKKNEFAFFQT